MIIVKVKNTIYLSFPTGTDPHLHIVLTNPVGNPEKILVVNLSSYSNKPFQDDTVILNKGDHPFIKHESYVAYDYAKQIQVSVLKKLIEEGDAKFLDNVSDDLYKKITDGLLSSKRTPSGLKGILRRHL